MLARDVLSLKFQIESLEKQHFVNFETKPGDIIYILLSNHPNHGSKKVQRTLEFRMLESADRLPSMTSPKWLCFIQYKIL